LTNGTIVTNPPPCNNTNIEAVISCHTTSPMSNLTVTSELYNNKNKLVRRSTEKTPRYFLFGNTRNNINDGRIPSGTYNIRVTLYGVVGPKTFFTLGGSCV
jgi:hypothetical protein